MKTLNYHDMSVVKAGSLKSLFADLGCLGVGLSYGLINPLLGAVMGIGCGLVVYYKS
jgi:hypothetical protein